MNSKLPSWFKQDIPDELTLRAKAIFSEFAVNTVCQEAKCPSITYCFKNRKAAFMILGNTCTRNCRFCAVNKSENKSLVIDKDEPYRISEVVKLLALNYVIITSVTRDDFPDGGANMFAKTIELIHGVNKNIKIEVLIPDFQGKISSLKCIVEAGPLVVAHNIETIQRLYRDLRPQADYRRSLELLSKIKELKPHINTKSSIMLGLGETEREVIGTMEDLRIHQCDILTLGQYLAPSIDHYPIKEFIKPEQFQKYRDIAIALGFKAVLSGPLVRSSYQAEKVCEELFNV